MTRLEGRYTRKANSRTSGIGLQSRPEAAARAGGRQSGVIGRRRPSAADGGSMTGMTAERHDWLVPMELP
jgi:hypothetical protein